MAIKWIIKTKNKLILCKKENGRLHQLLIDIFYELDDVREKIGIVETAVVNSDEGTERYIVELSEMLIDIMLGINSEEPEYTSMFADDTD